MNQPDTARSRHGHERTCPHCGARVAQRARTCFFCGASLEDAPRRRLTIPWADITLFAVIGGLVLLWWLRPPGDTTQPRDLLAALVSTPVAQKTLTSADVLAMPTERSDAAALAPTATPSVAPTATPLPPTVTPTATPSALPTSAATAVTYKVRGGDTLQVIADRYNVTIKALIDANNLSADGFIRVGDELTIPAQGGAVQPAAASPAPTATPTGGTLIYRVSAGDTVAGIAQRYGSSVQWILEANKMSADDYLAVGQSLMIPLSNQTPQPTATCTPPPPTTTPTAGPRFTAPILIGPGDASAVGGEGDVVLSWASVGVLAEDEWYVVTLTSAAPSVTPVPPLWTKSTTWRLSGDLRGSGGEIQAASAATGGDDGIEFTWQVQVVSGSPARPGPALSPASPARKFKWQ